MPLTLACVPNDTRVALSGQPVPSISRSLYFDRFTDPALEMDDRRNYFTEGFRAHTSTFHLKAWQSLIDSGALKGEVLYAQLQSRLMVNMAGGVMENAGLRLDRYGMPYIPGSAVKGCARRAALAALHEWCETGSKPSEPDNLFTPACAPFADPAQMLATLARVFGWCDQDWSSDKTQPSKSIEMPRWKSDFAWACTPTPIEPGQPATAAPSSPYSWEIIRRETAQILALDLGILVPESDAAPWNILPNFAGSVSFLPGILVEVPTNENCGPTPFEGTPPPGHLELDIVTGHHGDYYRSEDPNAVARDIEEPVPVVFPSIAARQVFTFCIVPLGNSPKGPAESASRWLTCGLTTFGIGAKTNAGYGWFEDVTAHKRDHDGKVREAAERIAHQAELAAAQLALRANLSPDPLLMEEFSKLKEDALRGRINAFATEEKFWSQRDRDERVQLTLLHYLTAVAPDLLANDRANPKSKIAKAIANLSIKFPQVAQRQP